MGFMAFFGFMDFMTWGWCRERLYDVKWVYDECLYLERTCMRFLGFMMSAFMWREPVWDFWGLWGEQLEEVYGLHEEKNLYDFCRVYEESACMSFMGFMRILFHGNTHLWGWWGLEFYGVFRGCLFEEYAFMRFIGIMRRAPLWGLWVLQGKCLCELYEVFEVSTFMKRVHLWGLWDLWEKTLLLGKHLYRVYEVSTFIRWVHLWGLWDFWGEGHNEV